ncbi:hypothetical protein DEU29_10519 [Idiomarina aquatica]|uniref:Uncharacterized protein n=1 Tax=Idiomarina aquatica TaxID=1327752 RepID=A0A4R6PII0_9GAMM|nr:hypothetical protein DEU29_10519 [Idiomarina aquatica]
MEIISITAQHIVDNIDAIAEGSPANSYLLHCPL